jgi:hypothetical protein
MPVSITADASITPSHGSQIRSEATVGRCTGVPGRPPRRPVFLARNRSTSSEATLASWVTGRIPASTSTIACARRSVVFRGSASRWRCVRGDPAQIRRAGDVRRSWTVGLVAAVLSAAVTTLRGVAGAWRSLLSLGSAKDADRLNPTDRAVRGSPAGIATSARLACGGIDHSETWTDDA